MNLKLYIYLFFLCLGTATVCGQDFSVKNYSIEDDLPYINFKSVVQLDNGYFYLATDHQVYRYDGLQFQEIPLSQIIPGQGILSFHSRGNDLILQTETGYFVVDQQMNVNFVSLANRFLNEKVLLKISDKNEVILLTNHQLVSIAKDRDFKEKPLTFSGNITDFTFYNSKILFHNENNLYLLDTLSMQVELLFGKPSIEIKDFTVDVKNDIIYLTDGRQVFQFISQLKLVIPIKNSQKITGDITGILCDQSKLHICTTTGFYWYDPLIGDVGKKASVQSGLLSNNVLASLPSRNESVILLLTDIGISKLAPNYFKDFVVFNPNTNSGNIFSIYPIDNQKILLGTTSGLKIISSSSLLDSKVISNHVITKIIPVADEFIMTDQDDNFYWLNNKYEIKLLKLPLIKEKVVLNTSLVLSSEHTLLGGNNFLWLAEAGGLLDRFKIDFPIHHLGEVRNEIYGASFDKLYRLKVNRKSSSVDYEMIYQSHNGIISSLLALDDSIVFSQSDGLHSLTLPEMRTNQFPMQRFMGSSIKQIFKDNHHRLWVLTNNGINMWNGKTFMIYGTLQGMPSVNVLPNTIYSLSDNQIMMSSPKRIILFSPKSTEEKWNNSSVNIDKIYIYDRLLEKKDKIYIKYNENYLRFEFSLPVYTAPLRTLFQYRMLGLDTTWITTERENFVSYTFLEPGNYRFQIKATVWGMNQSTTISEQFIVVTPPWWETVWFKVFLPIVIFFLIVFIINYQFKRKQYLIAQLEAEVKKRTVELERLARIDGLTKVYNRRTFDEFLDVEYERSIRFDHPLSLAFADIDFFKKINDKYLHHTGDIVLAILAEQMQILVRSVDIVCRYGGEEFCILFPHTDLEEAVEISERIRKNIQDYPWESVAPDLKVTISIGVSCFPETAKTKNDLMEVADTNLYKAKNSGRNNTVS